MKPRVLVVDDEHSIQQLLKSALTLSGFEVALAGNEAEFRKQAFSQKPHVIILDIMLGDADGTQIYQHLLRDGLDEKIPVVFLSALAGDRPPTLPQANRRYSLIGKPFDCDELVRELHDLIGIK